GISSGSGSNGNRSANAGSRSEIQVASGSNLAKKGLPTRLGSRAWIMCRTNTRWPASSVTPSTHTLPGVADMDGPRTVRATPDPAHRVRHDLGLQLARVGEVRHEGQCPAGGDDLLEEPERVLGVGIGDEPLRPVGE